MKKFNEAKAKIDQDLEQVFQKIYREVNENYLIVADDLDRLYPQMKNFIPTKIRSQKSLILDTVLNYLTQDARKILEGSDNKVINAFYEKNQSWIHTIKNEFQPSGENNLLLLRRELSLIVLVVSFLVSFLFVFFILRWGFIISFGIACFVAAFTYKKVTSVIKKRIYEDVERYIQQSKMQTKQELEEIVEDYTNNFNDFLADQNLA